MIGRGQGQEWRRHTGRCADELEAAGESGLDHLARVDAAFGLAEVEQHV